MTEIASYPKSLRVIPFIDKCIEEIRKKEGSSYSKIANELLAEAILARVISEQPVSKSKK